MIVDLKPDPSQTIHCQPADASGKSNTGGKWKQEQWERQREEKSNALPLTLMSGRVNTLTTILRAGPPTFRFVSHGVLLLLLLKSCASRRWSTTHTDAAFANHHHVQH